MNQTKLPHTRKLYEMSGRETVWEKNRDRAAAHKREENINENEKGE